MPKVFYLCLRHFVQFLFSQLLTLANLMIFMTKLFNATDIKDFENRFSTDEQCLEYLEHEKWKDGFVCKKCGHSNYCKGSSPHSRRCTRCKSQESATAHTIFHRCKIPIHEAFKMAFLVCFEPNISSYEISRRSDIRQMTCWNLKKKIAECINEHGDINIIQKNEFNEKM